jgi:hypothetical protein
MSPNSVSPFTRVHFKITSVADTVLLKLSTNPKDNLTNIKKCRLKLSMLANLLKDNLTAIFFSLLHSTSFKYNKLRKLCNITIKIQAPELH